MLMKATAAERLSEHVNKDVRIALLIGSGFGGLAAAVRLTANGWRVQVLEKQYVPGGRARLHFVDGYTFDAGPTTITVPFFLEELWALARRKLIDDVDLSLINLFSGSALQMGTTTITAATPSTCAPRCCGSILRRGQATPRS